MSRPSPGYARVCPRFWAQAREENWTDDMVVLALYLLTCEQRTTEGIFRLPVEYMSADLPEGWVSERVRVSLAALEEQGFLRYDHKARVVFLPKAMKYQRPDNRNQQIAALRNLLELPETSLLAEFISAAKQYCPAFADFLASQGLRQGLRQGLPQWLRQGIPDPPAPTPAPTPTLKTPVADSCESAAPDLEEKEIRKESSRRAKVSAATEDDWQRRADEMLEQSHFPSDLMQLAELLASENKTGKAKLSRVVRELYEPIVRLQDELSDEQLRYGLRAAITASAPNWHYVAKAARGYEPPLAVTSAGIDRSDYDDFYTGGAL